MIRVQGLTKRIPHRTLFHRLDFVWDKPGIICINGANGSGKTTLLSLLAGALTPDAGEIMLLGKSLNKHPHTALQQLTYAPDNCPIYPFITGREWLAFVKALKAFNADCEQALLVGFGLIPHLDCRFGEMSLGTARKFLLTSTLMSQSKLIILDEPSNGLDHASFDFLCEHLSQIQTESLIALSCLDKHQQQLLGAKIIELASLEQR